MDIWKWLLSMLDARITVFVTRSASWKAYREAMKEAGLPVDILEQFNLENKVVSAGKSTQDFHAKFYAGLRSEEHTSELQSLMRNSYAVFCLKKKKKILTSIK